MHRDVVAVGLLLDAPIIKGTLECLVRRPRCALYAEVLCWVTVLLGALNLVGVPHVAVAGLDVLAQLKTVQ